MTYTESIKRYAKRIYAERKAKGLCVSCGKNKAENGVRCEKCKTIVKRNRMLRKEYLLSKGKCIVCGKTNAVQGKKTCFKCALQRSEWYEHRNKLKNAQ